MCVKYFIISIDLKIEDALLQTKSCSDVYNIWDHSFSTCAKFSEKLTKACNFTKSNTPPWLFSRFLNCTNGTKSRDASQILKIIYYISNKIWMFLRETINKLLFMAKMGSSAFISRKNQF